MLYRFAINHGGILLISTNFDNEKYVEFPLSSWLNHVKPSCLHPGCLTLYNAVPAWSFESFSMHIKISVTDRCLVWHLSRTPSGAQSTLEMSSQCPHPACVCKDGPTVPCAGREINHGTTVASPFSVVTCARFGHKLQCCWSTLPRVKCAASVSQTFPACNSTCHGPTNLSPTTGFQLVIFLLLTLYVPIAWHAFLTRQRWDNTGSTWPAHPIWSQQSAVAAAEAWKTIVQEGTVPAGPYAKTGIDTQVSNMWHEFWQTQWPGASLTNSAFVELEPHPQLHVTDVADLSNLG